MFQDGAHTIAFMVCSALGAIVGFLSFLWVYPVWLWPAPEAACVHRGGTALLEETGCTSKPSAIYFILVRNDLGIQLRRIIDNLPQPGESSLLCGISKVIILQFCKIKTS